MNGVSKAFRDVADTHDPSRLVLDLDGAAIAALTASLSTSRLLLLGEMHGVAENASLVYGLMRALDVTWLGLEWESELGRVLHPYVATGRLAFDISPYQCEQLVAFRRGQLSRCDNVDWHVLTAHALYSRDGRVTAEYFALLRRLHRDGLLRGLILFETTGPDWSGRDEAMAARILDVWDRTSPLLVVAGNAHTELSDSALGRPLGAHLAAAVPGVRNINIDYVSGERYHFGVKTLAPRAKMLRRPRLDRREDDSYVIQIAEVNAATVCSLPASLRT